MEWYYAENNERRGPVDEVEFGDLVRRGRITPETQVWRDGWAEWRSFGASGAGDELTNIVPSGTANCTECGRTFPTSEMVQYGDSWICPTCKPVFFQKVKEGVDPTAAMVYGGFWIRFGALLIDSIILGIAGFLLQMPFAGLVRDPARAMAGLAAVWTISFSLRLAYFTFLTGKYGATVGKMACGLRVVTPAGGKIGYGLACGRYLAQILSGLILCIGYIMAATDEEKRALHDRICNTRVIRGRA